MVFVYLFPNPRPLEGFSEKANSFENRKHVEVTVSNNVSLNHGYLFTKEQEKTCQE